MDQRIYHGNLTPGDLARALIGHFNRGNLRAVQIGNNRDTIVQIGTHERSRSGGQTSLAITLRPVADGVAVEVGKQSWLGVAASLGQSAFYAWHRPFSLLDRFDDIAQDIENIQLAEDVWQVIEEAARAIGAGQELSERLRRVACAYCQTANPVGEPACIACGAPLGPNQPRTCLKCGFVLKKGETICPQCAAPV